MKFFTRHSMMLLLLLLLLGTRNGFAGIDDIHSMIRRSDGQFDVRCRDNTAEIATVYHIQQNHVCGHETLRCIQKEDSFSNAPYYITRISDGERLGGGLVSFERCNAMIAIVHEGLICTQPDNAFSNAPYYITRISDGERLGGGLSSFERCKATIESAQEGLVCTQQDNAFSNAPYYITRISDGERLGGSLSFTRCEETIRQKNGED